MINVAGQNRAREKFAIVAFVEPCALEIEERNSGEVRKRERIDSELRERLIGARVRFVVEDMDRAIPDL